MKLLTKSFLSKFDHAPAHMNELGAFVYYRTYSRYLPEEGRRETWKETVERAVEYNLGLAVKHYEKTGRKITKDIRALLKSDAELLFTNMYNLRQFLSGRTLWVGGAEGGVADKYPLANFNCAFNNIETLEDIGDLFYLLLVGTGVGLKSELRTARNLPPVRNNLEIIHEPFVQRYPLVKIGDTSEFVINDGKKLVVHIGDSKEGWVDALRIFLRALSVADDKYAKLESIGFYYDYIRPRGSRLHTFGGTASGYEPLKEMFVGIEKVIKGELDPSLAKPATASKAISDTEVQVLDGFVNLRPIHILDIANLIGNNVVVGGVRRTAEIFLFDAEDYESLVAKLGINGIYGDDKFEQLDKIEQAMIREGVPVPAFFADLKVKHYTLTDEDGNVLFTSTDPNETEAWANEHDMEYFPFPSNTTRTFLSHRRMSNNSIAFNTKPSKGYLDMVFTIMQGEAEPGFINMEEARRRRPDAEGLNPCAEILLASKGVCNLTTVNMMQFVKQDANGEHYLDKEALFEAQALSARSGIRMTTVTLELPAWDYIQRRDALIGTSLTGVKDAMGQLGWDQDKEDELLAELAEVVEKAKIEYSAHLNTNVPLLDTTIKPEGTQSQVAGGVSSGLHYAHAEYYIRRVRVNSNDALAKMALDLGWTVHAEVGTKLDGVTYLLPADLARPEVMAVAKTWVIDFPVHSPSAKVRDDVSAVEQLDVYFSYQKHYTRHNTSNTISVKSNEWDAVCDKVYDQWDDFVGVSFMAHDGGSYTLAPYEEVTKEQYEALKASMKPFDKDLLPQYETGFASELDETDNCANGACAIR